MLESNYLQVTEDNIDSEHICCCISDKKCIDGYNNKKLYLKEAFKNGMEFWKLNVRHKVFIQFEPLETAWYPIDGEDINFISCFWAAGKYKGAGHGKELLKIALEQSAKKNGLAVIVGKRKKPFLNDKKFFLAQGFEVIDECGDYQLMYYSIKDTLAKPKFRENAKLMKNDKEGISIYYSSQCPYGDYYTREIEKRCEELKVPFEKIYIDSLEKAKNLPHPFTIYSLYHNGDFVTNEIYTVKKLEKLLKRP